MPLQATSGAASYDGFGGGVAVVPNYIEDVFSTWLYTGTGAAQTITNGIDLSTKGGLVWVKGRNDAWDHTLYDTVRGVSVGPLNTATNGAPNPANNQRVTAFNTNGFSLGTNANVNGSTYTYVSWTFREQPKFFDVVTYTGTGTAHAINHNLDSVPGFIIVKSTSVAGSWYCYHRGTNGGVNPQNYGMNLGATAAQLAYINFWNNTAPTATQFTVGDAGGETNETGVSYIAYLFANDAGGFGRTGTDNVISCGSFTLDGSNTAIITLGYEPQWVLVKRTNAAANWAILDNMRGLITSGVDAALRPNTSNAETNGQEGIYPTATGFGANTGLSSAGDTYIYIAMRRGPMKVPTLGTSVYNAIARTGTGAAATVTAGFPVDMTIIQDRNGLNSYAVAFDRLRGATKRLFTALTLAEATEATSLTGFDVQTGFTLGTDLGFGAVNTSPDNYVNWCFGRAPGFFDEVCYTGNYAGNPQIPHNLTVAPEMIIVKNRGATATQWYIYHQALGTTSELYFNSNAVNTPTPPWTVTSTYWKYEGAQYPTGENHVAYLFATCPGVSKVGSYTGNGTTQTINCGFTAGARFVLIKRTDAVGDWYVWDSARGIVAGNDPYLLLNSTAAEVTSTDYIDTYSAGFEISSTAPAAINASAGTFVFLAVA